MKHIDIALGEVGVKEILGNQDNPRIIEYFNELGFDGSKLHDETSWCAAFANWVLKKAGLEYQKTLNARSFLDIGWMTETPKLGDVVIYWRESPDSWKGHVGFYINEKYGYIWTLGGNQGNQVQISAYPKNKVLGYRRMTNE